VGARESEQKAVVGRFIDRAFNAGDPAFIDELVSSDYVLHGTPEVRGPEGMKHFVTIYRTAFPDYACTVEDQIAEGDKVVTRWTARGTQQGELMGIPPTGSQVTPPGVVIDRIANGQLVESWLQADVLGMLQQLGVVHAPAGAAA
jgi:predicted ester cyclase